MGTIAQKLTYLDDTKSLLKDKINALGGNIDNSTTFREYAEELDTIYSSLPKVTGEGTEVTLSPTLKGKLGIIPKGNSIQEGTPTPENPISISSVTGNNNVVVRGKNLFNKNATPVSANTSLSLWTATALETGIRVKLSRTSSGTLFALWAIKDLTNCVGKTVRVKSNWVASGNRTGGIGIYVGSNLGTNVTQKARGTSSGNTISWVVENLEEGKEYLLVALFNNPTTGATENDYIDYTDLIVTIDNEDMTYEPYYTPQTKPLNLGTKRVMLGDSMQDDGIHHVRGRIRVNTTNFSVSLVGSVEQYPNLFSIQHRTNTNFYKTIAGFCTHFTLIENDAITSANTAKTNLNDNECAFRSNTMDRLYVKSTSFSTNEEIRTFLDNNEVYLEYDLQDTDYYTESYTTEEKAQYDDIQKMQGYNGTTIITSTYESSNAQMYLAVSGLKGE